MALPVYGLCQTGCNTAWVACYAAAGLVAGTVTAGAAVPAAALTCNAQQGLCMAACAAMTIAGTGAAAGAAGAAGAGAAGAAAGAGAAGAGVAGVAAAPIILPMVIVAGGAAWFYRRYRNGQ